MENKKEMVEAVCWAIHRVANKLTRLEGLPIKSGGNAGITHRELHFLQIIGETGLMNVVGLARHFGITKSAASQMAVRLEKKGLIVKKPSDQSGKEVELSLSHQGLAAYGLHENFHVRNMETLVERLSAFSLSQIATASVLLEVVESVLEETLD